jgi:hypothetical protein
LGGIFEEQAYLLASECLPGRVRGRQFIIFKSIASQRQQQHQLLFKKYNVKNKTNYYSDD